MLIVILSSFGIFTMLAISLVSYRAAVAAE
jgi:hypothetical protein